MKIWNNFLLKEVSEKRIRHGVFKPTQHYLNHIPFMIRKQGPLYAYSGRSMERTIGQYKKLIKSKVAIGANAGNFLERTTLYNYIFALNLNIKERISLQGPKKYGDDTYEVLTEGDGFSTELWAAPLLPASLSSLSRNVTPPILKNALNRFYTRIDSQASSLSFNELIIAGRCWFNEDVYQSILYSKYIRETRRGNNYIMFEIPFLTNSSRTNRWYIGAVVFFFQHVHAGIKRHLALVDVAGRHSILKTDQYTPIVTMRRRKEHKFVVVQLKEIVCSVGLVRMSTDNNRKFKAISHHIHLQIKHSVKGLCSC